MLKKLDQEPRKNITTGYESSEVSREKLQGILSDAQVLEIATYLIRNRLGDSNAQITNKMIENPGVGRLGALRKRITETFTLQVEISGEFSVVQGYPPLANLKVTSVQHGLDEIVLQVTLKDAKNIEITLGTGFKFKKFPSRSYGSAEELANEYAADR